MTPALRRRAAAFLLAALAGAADAVAADHHDRRAYIASDVTMARAAVLRVVAVEAAPARA